MAQTMFAHGNKWIKNFKKEINIDKFWALESGFLLGPYLTY
jgi:hypothetical protein